MPRKLLFICSRNQWRSKTAETIFRKRDDLDVKSAGTASNARIRVNEGMIRWADTIYVMERKHERYLLTRFSRLTKYKNIVVLDIPDNYKYMDPELIAELEDVIVE